MRPEIGIDARFISSGLGTYTYNLLKHLNARDRFAIKAVTRKEYVEVLRPYCDSFRFVEAGMYTATEQWSVAKAASGCDVFHAIHYNVPVLHRGKVLVTIHDLTHLLDKSLKRAFKSIVYAHPMLRFASSRAAQVITVSEYSKRNLIEILGVQEEKISVIPNGVGEEFYPEAAAYARAAIKPILGFDDPYILYVGNLKRHKNVDGLLRAFRILSSKGRCDHKLVVIGEDKIGAPVLMRLANELGLNDKVVFLGRTDQKYIRSFYCGATLAVLPSLQEGFGLPVLESMACGTPVACSNVASMPEVGGDAAEYFDPVSLESIACSLERLISSGDLRAKLARRGLERAKKFTWQASGKAHLALYSSLTN